MHVQLRRAGAVALLAIGGLFASSACVANESSLFIRSCLAFPRDTCLVQPSITSTFQAEGFIDGYIRGEYVCAALVENQLVQRGDSTRLRVETSRVSLYQAEVQVLTTDPVNPTAYAKFTVPVSGFVDPGQGTEPGIGSTLITLIDYTTLKTLADEAVNSNTIQKVVASVVLHGRTLGGVELTSNEFKFPIDVCGGCSCTMPAGDVCVGSEQKPATDCLIGQDALVDCRAIDQCSLMCRTNTLGQPDLASATCPNLVAGNPAYSSCCP